MKYRINDIYDDLNTIITDNPLLLADERLTDLMALKNDLDIIIESEFGTREILSSLLKEDDTETYIYNLNKIYRSVYSCFLANLSKWTALLTTYQQFLEYNPMEDYAETRIWGEKEKTNVIGQQIDTNQHGQKQETKVYGAKSETKTYGNIETQATQGQSTDTTTNGTRVNTTAVNPSFGTDFTDTDKTTGATSTDSTQYGARSDSETTTHGNDTTSHATYTDTDTTGTYTDTNTKGTRTDRQTEPETTDVIKGYKNGLGLIERQFALGRQFDLVKTIATDVVNQISYNLYL